ncbi:enhanced serine sensitivity protein SseB [Streptomyces triticagri]|uniref:Enhanced serine sensitivity protein SseB n=1 Tax=Streptomyces triticagri TaxID=2293568 RepID=A0A372MB98_9ACTN|nr:enhanced serine sensitivity protein SseB [Streptomyces triticagri]RFU88224.1 enhanced serine sensitivity protein SseB [Streptomyces triticagri]
MDVPAHDGPGGPLDQGGHGGLPDGQLPGPDRPGGGHPPHIGWPGNELEEVLAASVGVPSAAGRIVEVLGRSLIWIPLPNGGGRQSRDLDLPAMELGGQAYVPVFSSQAQFLSAVGGHMPFVVAPAVEFARGLPPQLGIAVNPDGTVGVPLPPEAVAELCRSGRTPLDGPASGGRVRLYEPDWQDDPVDFLSAAAEEFAATGVVATARRCLASVEGGDPVMFVGVELSQWEPTARNLPMDALGRALGRAPARWPVNLVLLDVAQDPVGDWMRERVRPFHRQDA